MLSFVWAGRRRTRAARAAALPARAHRLQARARRRGKQSGWVACSCRQDASAEKAGGGWSSRVVRSAWRRGRERSSWNKVVSRSRRCAAARRAEEKAEEAVDVQAALASLEQKAPAKRSREVVKGELGFEELGQSELLGMAFEDASAEKEFQEAKQKEVEQALEAARKRQQEQEEIREALGGNVCRCTGYVKIEAAVEAAAEKLRKGDQ